MRIDTARSVDYWIGIPLCFLLSLAARVVDWLRIGRNRARPRTFLFIELSEMGSAILAYPAMRAIQREHPGAELFFLIFERNRASVDVLGIVPRANVVTIPDASTGAFLVGAVRALARLRRERIDVVLDLELFSRVSAILSFATGAPVRVGFHRYRMEGLYRGRLHTHWIQYNFQQHISRSFLSFVDVLRYPTKRFPSIDRRPGDGPLEMPSYPVDEARRAAALAKIRTRAPNMRAADRIVVLSPGGGEIPIRAWPLDHYVELAMRLVSEPSTIVVLSGCASDRTTTSAITARVGSERCVDLAGDTTFEELLELFGVATAVVCNDGGPAHFATLTPTRSLVFLGPESPSLYGPLGDRTHVLYAGLPCSPCLTAFNHRNSPCRDNRCLQLISVQEVFDRIRHHTSWAEPQRTTSEAVAAASR